MKHIEISNVDKTNLTNLELTFESLIIEE